MFSTLLPRPCIRDGHSGMMDCGIQYAGQIRHASINGPDRVLFKTRLMQDAFSFRRINGPIMSFE